MHSEEANSRGTKGFVRTSAKIISGLVPSTPAVTNIKRKFMYALHPDRINSILLEFLLFESSKFCVPLVYVFLFKYLHERNLSMLLDTFKSEVNATRDSADYYRHIIISDNCFTN